MPPLKQWRHIQGHYSGLASVRWECGKTDPVRVLPMSKLSFWTKEKGDLDIQGLLERDRIFISRYNLFYKWGTACGQKQWPLFRLSSIFVLMNWTFISNFVQVQLRIFVVILKVKKSLHCTYFSFMFLWSFVYPWKPAFFFMKMQWCMSRTPYSFVMDRWASLLQDSNTIFLNYP